MTGRLWQVPGSAQNSWRSRLSDATHWCYTQADVGHRNRQYLWAFPRTGCVSLPLRQPLFRPPVLITHWKDDRFRPSAALRRCASGLRSVTKVDRQSFTTRMQRAQVGTTALTLLGLDRTALGAARHRQTRRRGAADRRCEERALSVNPKMRRGRREQRPRVYRRPRRQFGASAARQCAS